MSIAVGNGHFSLDNNKLLIFSVIASYYYYNEAQNLASYSLCESKPRYKTNQKILWQI